MLKRLLNRDKAADSTPPEAVAIEETTVVSTKPSAPAATPPRKTKSMRDSDIKDEHGRSAEEIAAEAAREFDIDAVVRKAASLPDAQTNPVPNAPASQPQASPAQLQTPAPQTQPVATAQVPPVASPPAASEAHKLEIQQGHIFLPGPGSDAVAKTADARDAYWESIGISDDEFLTYPVSPQVMGAPAWPTHHQRFRIVRTVGSLIIASEGLSDPFSMFDPRGGVNGFGLEVFIELEALQHLSPTEIRKSWAFRAIEFTARVAAQAETLSQGLSGHEVLSMDMPRECAPQGWVEPGVAEPAGALLNVAQPPGRSRIPNMPLSPVAVVPMTPIYPEELESCVIEGPAERRALANDLLTSGAGHRMSLTRTSLR